MKSLKRKPNSKGMTLVELIVSIALLSIMFIAFTTFFAGVIGRVIWSGELDKNSTGSGRVLEGAEAGLVIANLDGNVVVTGKDGYGDYTLFDAMSSTTSTTMVLIIGGTEYTVHGTLVTVEKTTGDADTAVSEFIPER